MVDRSPLARFSGPKLLGARHAIGLSRVRLCLEIGFAVGPQTLARYERGRTAPSVDVAMRLAKALHVTLWDLTDAEG